MITMQMIKTEKAVFGKPITATAITLDHGYQITIFGGTRTHIGATTRAEDSGHLTSVSFPGHKEQVITESWAKSFFARFRKPVCVTAGIHYDNLSPQEIRSILEETDQMLLELLEHL